MKAFSLYILVFLLFVTASCSNEKQEALALDENTKQIIFFTDEKEYKGEAAYYDALIELKKDFPAEMENLTVLSSAEEKQYYKEFNIKSGPALLVIYKEKVMVRINGNASKEQIIKPVSNAFGKSLNAN